MYSKLFNFIKPRFIMSAPCFVPIAQPNPALNTKITLLILSRESFYFFC